jgi:hypothetical protein
MNKTEKPEYQAPKLTKFGDFRSLTLTKGTTDHDSLGAQAKTRSHGGSFGT